MVLLSQGWLSETEACGLLIQTSTFERKALSIRSYADEQEAAKDTASARSLSVNGDCGRQMSAMVR
jgi:hypothetical protein